MSSWQMFGFWGGKCPNLGVVNVRILGVVNVCLANDLPPTKRSPLKLLEFSHGFIISYCGVHVSAGGGTKVKNYYYHHQSVISLRKLVDSSITVDCQECLEEQLRAKMLGKTRQQGRARQLDR